jgi:hypothetical protein
MRMRRWARHPKECEMETLTDPRMRRVFAGTGDFTYLHQEACSATYSAITSSPLVSHATFARATTKSRASDDMEGDSGSACDWGCTGLGAETCCCNAPKTRRWCGDRRWFSGGHVNT